MARIFALLFFSVYLVCESRSFSWYTPHWLIAVPEVQAASDKRSLISVNVDEIAQRVGLVNLGNVGELKYVYRFYYPNGSNQEYPSITEKLRNETEKVDAMSLAAYVSFLNPAMLIPNRNNETRRLITYTLPKEVVFVEQEYTLRIVLRDYKLPTDPQFQHQWPLYNSGQTRGPSGFDINVVPVWIQGVTGLNTTIAVIDDGVQINHPDLAANIDLEISYSFTTDTNDPSPDFRLPEYSHGTSCAGEIVMIKDNGICGTGVAYNAKLGGIQFPLNSYLPSQEARSFQFRNDLIQIYSNSYGPLDDGFTVGGPGHVSQLALLKAVTDGRGGMGCIYVFSSGNGGEYDDSCAADGYVNSIHTIAVGSANQQGRQAVYDENCSAKMAVTYSYDNQEENNQLVTTFVSDECVRNFTGTSASSPLVSGVIALALEVNPQLSWRDVQYLIAYTSDVSKLVGGYWVTNGAGLRVSPQFGFGAINAEAMVNRARYWTPVEDMQVYDGVLIDSVRTVNLNNPFNHQFTVPPDIDIKYLENAVFTVGFDVIPNNPNTECYTSSDYDTNQNVVNHSGARRGDAKITICSPSGTCSLILPKRPRDFINCDGYDNWPFLSVHFWAENPAGVWNMTFTFETDSGIARLQYFRVTLYGIQNKPEDVLDSCDPSCDTPTGCSAGNGSQYCDACGSGLFRNSTTMECVKTCSPNACVIEDICVFYNGTCPRTSSRNALTTSEIIITAALSGLIALLLLCFLVIIVCVVCVKCGRKHKGRTQLINEVITEDTVNGVDSTYTHYND